MIEASRNDRGAALRIAEDEGAGTALNRFIYNRDLTAVLVAGTLALACYAAVIRPLMDGTAGLAVTVLVFGPLFWLVRRVVLRPRFTEVRCNRVEGTVRVIRPTGLGRKEDDARLADWGYLRVDEIAPRDTDDLKEIYRWQEMAEPGVHARPTPVFRVVLVGKNEEPLLDLYEGTALDDALAVKRELTALKAGLDEPTGAGDGETGGSNGGR